MTEERLYELYDKHKLVRGQQIKCANCGHTEEAQLYHESLIRRDHEWFCSVECETEAAEREAWESGIEK